jgi:hypothetical protein
MLSTERPQPSETRDCAFGGLLPPVETVAVGGTLGAFQICVRQNFRDRQCIALHQVSGESSEAGHLLRTSS